MRGRVGQQKEVQSGENIAMFLLKKLSPVNFIQNKKKNILHLYRLTKYIQSLTLIWGGGKEMEGKEEMTAKTVKKTNRRAKKIGQTKGKESKS